MLNLLKHAVFLEEEGAHALSMLCVSCHEEMREHRFGVVCRSCGSKWLHLGRLERAGHAALCAQLRILASPMESPSRGRPCPGCAVPMALVRTSEMCEEEANKRPAQRLDVCAECDIVWLDPQELADLG